MSDLTTGWATHVGLVRRDNEDAGYVGRRVWAVADGMGGHAAGEVASRLAIEAMRDLDAVAAPDRAALVAAVEDANNRLLSYAHDHRSARGLGTTLVGVAHLHDGRLCVFNIGDSRAYLLEAGRLRQVSVDHSEVEELLADGLITAEEARVHPLRNIITRALGMPQTPTVDTWFVDPAPGDRLLLCSDGLTGELPDDGIEAILRDTGGAQAAADALLWAALDGGGHDNVTVIVLDVGHPDQG